MTICVQTTGRNDLWDYFEQSGIRERKTLKHTPFLVFQIEGRTVTVRCIDNAKDLLTWPDDTPVMGQWQGQWRSDFFQFTVGQLRAHVTAHPRAYGLV